MKYFYGVQANLQVDHKLFEQIIKKNFIGLFLTFIHLYLFVVCYLAYFSVSGLAKESVIVTACYYP